MGEEAEIKLAKGKSYLVKEKRPELSYRTFERDVTRKTPGLCISREHPSRLKKKFKNTRLIWISQTPGKDYYEPTALNSITRLVCQFVEEKERCVIMLDCLEYLIVHNGFEHSFKAVELINEFVMQREASVIIPMNPDALEPKQVSLLERGLEVVEMDEARASIVDEDLVDLMEKY